MPGIRMQLVSLLVLELNQWNAGRAEGQVRRPGLKRAEETRDQTGDLNGEPARPSQYSISPRLFLRWERRIMATIMQMARAESSSSQDWLGLVTT